MHSINMSNNTRTVPVWIVRPCSWRWWWVLVLLYFTLLYCTVTQSDLLTTLLPSRTQLDARHVLLLIRKCCYLDNPPQFVIPTLRHQSSMTRLPRTTQMLGRSVSRKAEMKVEMLLSLRVGESAYQGIPIVTTSMQPE